MTVPVAAWSEVYGGLPATGRVLYACHDQTTVTVFAAHDKAIGEWAVEHGRFGGEAWLDHRFTRFRMSFPRVMARSDCGRRAGKESVLGITIRRDRFDAVLRQAVHWREFPDALYETKNQWRLATRYSRIVLDWAPDVSPDREDLERFTVRFGVRKQALQGFVKDWIVAVHDLTELATAWRDGGDPATPVVNIYPPPEPGLASRLLWEPKT